MRRRYKQSKKIKKSRWPDRGPPPTKAEAGVWFLGFRVNANKTKIAEDVQG